MLIMACKDHTAHPRALVRNEPHFQSTTTAGDPLPRSVERERRTIEEAHRASTALAIAVISGMLRTDRAFKRTHKKGEKRGLLPLNQVQIFGLEAAIDLLHHHVDTFSSENGG
jgi:hypothetical protein